MKSMPTKYLLTVMFSFTVLFATAQNVNIPDPEFKDQLLNMSIDTNDDGEIDVSEALAVHKLYLYCCITDLTGIRAFTNLDTLDIQGLHVSDIDMSGMTSLRRLDISSDGNLDSVNFSGCSNLGYLNFSYTSNTIDTFSNFNISGTPRLKELFLTGVALHELDLRQNDSLTNLYCIWVHFDEVNISGTTKLENALMEGHVGILNAENATGLKITGGGYVDTGLLLDSINLTGCNNLLNFQVLEYTGHSISVNSCTNLDLFNLALAYNLESLDLSNCRRLHSINGVYYNLRNLNIKNGNADVLYFDASAAHMPPLHICTDDFETAAIDSMLQNYIALGDTIVVNSFCSALSIGGPYNTIAGDVRWDRDNNGCDNADTLMPYIPVRIINNNLGTYAIRYSSSFSGHYQYYDTAGNFTVSPYFPYSYFNVAPSSANVIFGTTNNLIDTNNFCITSNGNHNQLDITVLPTSRTSPGFGSWFEIHYRNRGTTTLSGNVQFNYDNNKLNYYFADSGPASVSPGQITWSYNNLQPFQEKVLSVILTTLPPPVNNVGDTLILLATITPTAGDETPSNNSYVLPRLLTGSFDPNDKLCLQGEKLDVAKVGDNLDYIIHFQNLGNDTAFNVVVTDTLSNHLDWESFDFTGASHPCDVQRKDNKLQFYFKDIHLPYASINEPASHGFVAFKIKPKNTVAIGDSLNNKASIYFDYNLPVVTNLATTIVVPTSSLAVKLEYFSLVSKDETNQLVWKASSTNGVTNFGIERSNDGIRFSNIGNITASMERCQSPFNFTDDKPFDGKTFYRLNIKDANGISFYSKVLVAERTRSGLSIIRAIVSNQNNTTVYLNVSKEQNVQMKVIAADGRLVYNQTKTIAAGSSTLNLQLKNLSTGIYTLIVYTNDGEVITKRFVK